MKITSILFLLFFSFGSINAQLLSARFATSFYGWQGISESLEKQNYSRIYENVQINIANNKFALTTNFIATKDFATSIATDPELRFSTLVLSCKKLFDALNINVGRQFVAGGVGSGFIDGGLASLRLFDNKFALTTYGGYNVIETRSINLKKNLPENAFYGGLLRISPLEEISLGLSYMNRTRKPESFKLHKIDSLYNPYIVEMTLNKMEEQYGSVNLSYEPFSTMRLYGRTDYDFNYERFSRAEVSLHYTLFEALTLTGDYLWRESRISYNSIFSVFTSKSTQEFEGGAEYEFTPLFKTFAKFAYVKYTDEESGRLNIGGNYDFLFLSYTQNFGYAGELNGISCQAVYPLCENLLTPTVGIGYAKYKFTSDSPENTVFNVNTALTYRPEQTLSITASLQYLNNRLYSNDTRIFITINYWLNSQLNLF
jgi:hypothetical protein